MADIHLPARIRGDMTVFKDLMKVSAERENDKPGPVLDYEFISQKAFGFDEFLNSLNQADWSEIESGSGLKKEEITAAADLIIASPTMVTCWAMGITQHRDAVATIEDIVNLHLLRGQIGKTRAGLCPVRGHSNVQ